MTDIRTIRLPEDTSKLDAAKVGVENGGLVWPVELNHGQYEPVAAFAGLGRSAWSFASRDLERIAQMFEDHPAATVGVRVPTQHGFDHHFALKGNAFVEIPAAVYRVGNQ